MALLYYYTIIRDLIIDFVLLILKYADVNLEPSSKHNAEVSLAMFSYF